MKLWLVVFLLVLTEEVLKVHGGWCEPGCDCRVDVKLTICSGAGFTQSPLSLPPSTELLDLSHNQLSSLAPRCFQGARKLRILLLQNNSISRVEDGTFSHLEFLQRLDLSRNHLTALGQGFSLGLEFLKELQLAYNWLSVLDSDSFYHLDALQRLNLTGNQIHNIQTRAFGSMSALRQLHLQDNMLTTLNSGMFSMLRSLEVLNLRGNQISQTDGGVFKPLTSLTLLSLTHNHMSSINFKTFVSLHTHSSHILFRGNPWLCDCELQRVFRKLRSVQRIFLDDYLNLSCEAPPILHGYHLTEVDTELCMAETVTVLIITVTVVITVLGALAIGERKRRMKKNVMHWTQQGEESEDSDHN